MLSCGKNVLLSVFAIVLIQTLAFSEAVVINQQDWEEFKLQFNKTFASTTADSNARYYYSYNKNLINTHNIYYNNGQRTFALKQNQFTDMQLTQFNALYPLTTQLSESYASPALPVPAAPVDYDPKDLGFSIAIEDQGINCNSGWAYAAAKSIEILQAMQMGYLQPASLSAQNLIDCAGRSSSCKNQVPQTAFDFLALYEQHLHLASDYPNRNTHAEQGFCVPIGIGSVNLAAYARIADGDDETLKMYVAAGYPVVIEINPTSFEFMHYSAGVFQQPRTNSGSHFMTVVGYGHDAATNLDYWLALNSFGRLWGEEGYIRIARSSTSKLAKSAIFPTELA